MLDARSLALLAGGLSVVVWALMPVVMKIGLERFEVFELLAGRFLIPSLIFLPLLAGLKKKFHKVPRKTWLVFSATLTANFLLQTFALKSLPASWYLVIFSLNPIFALLFYRTKFTKIIGFAVFGSLVGTWLFLDTNHISTVPSVAWLTMLGGMLTWAYYTRLIGSFQNAFSDWEITAVTNWIGMLSVVPPILWMGDPTKLVSGILGWEILVLGLSIPLAYYLYSFAIRQHRVVGVMAQYLEPVIGVGAAILFLGEAVTLQSAGGVALVIASMGLLVKGS